MTIVKVFTGLVLSMLAMPPAVAAETQKHSQSKSTNQGDPLTAKLDWPKELDWPQEPGSFAGLKFGEVTDLGSCPHYSAWNDMVKAKTAPAACISSEEKEKVWVWVAKDIRPLDDASILLHDGKFQGIRANFNSERFSELFLILKERYGPPRTADDVQVQTKGGHSFTNQNLMWLGPKIRIYVSSLVDRKYNSIDKRIESTGKFTIITVDYSKYLTEQSRLDTRNKASNF